MGPGRRFFTLLWWTAGVILTPFLSTHFASRRAEPSSSSTSRFLNMAMEEDCSTLQSNKMPMQVILVVVLPKSSKKEVIFGIIIAS